MHKNQIDSFMNAKGYTKFIKFNSQIYTLQY